jgi:glycosyltransferase involved in cell wall biosynthesis
MRVVGVSLVRNEERFVGQALLNVADFCDKIVVADHLSTVGTPAVLEGLSKQLDNLDVVRVRHSAESHALIEDLAGTETWVLSVDGDELYDPEGLLRFRGDLERGVHDDVFRVRPAALHCDSLDDARVEAAGYLSPPSRPLVGILNFAAVDSWSGVRSQRLHGGDIRFRPGYDLDSWRHLGMEDGWDASPFRALHLCFLERSSADPPTPPATGRPNLGETWRYRRGAVGTIERAARRLARRGAPAGAAQWKAEKYRRGDRVAVEASGFFR